MAPSVTRWGFFMPTTFSHNRLVGPDRDGAPEIFASVDTSAQVRVFFAVSKVWTYKRGIALVPAIQNLLTHACLSLLDGDTLG